MRGGSRIWSGGGPDRDRPKLPTVRSSIVQANRALFSMGFRAHLRALEALGFFIAKYAFYPFWGTFLYYFWDNKIQIFLDKLSWKTFCTYVYIKQNLDQNVYVPKTKNMYTKQNPDQHLHVSISKKIFLIQMLIYSA